MSPAVLSRHFRAVADASPVPVLLYNFSNVTGLNMAPDTVAALSAHPNIVGVHDFGEFTFRQPGSMASRTLYFFLMEYVDGATLLAVPIAIGTLLTIVVQSSSAAMTITITMAFKGWIERTGAGRPEDLQIMYRVTGERHLPEVTLDHLAGHSEFEEALGADL